MVDDSRIKKTKIKAREFFQTLAEIQFESGYPYIMFEDTVNRENPIDGKIIMSNLCSEILQVSQPTTYHDDLSYDQTGKDISCNLGSLNRRL
ncbi:Ribonucleoside-diphosphate reductase subunit alpha [compost metagenome]